MERSTRPLELHDHLIPGARVAGDWVGDDDFVVIELDSGRYYGLGPVGGYLWERLGSDRSLHEAVRKLARDFGISEERARKDTLEFAERLLALNLVTIGTA